MESYIGNFINFDDHTFVKKLKNASMSSFLNSQVSRLGFDDNWMRMVGGFLVKVPEKERFTIINHLWKFNGFGQQEKSKMIQFEKMMLKLGYNHLLVPYQKCDSHSSLATYILKVKDHIPKNSWIYCLSMLSAILYSKSMVDKQVIKFIVSKSNVSTSFLDTLDDANELLDLCKPYFETNNEEVTSGLNFGYNSMVDFYNELATLLEEEQQHPQQPSQQPSQQPQQPSQQPQHQSEQPQQPQEQQLQQSSQQQEQQPSQQLQEQQPSQQKTQEDVKPTSLFDNIKLEGVDMNDPSILEALRLLTEAPNEYDDKPTKHDEADQEDELYS